MFGDGNHLIHGTKEIHRVEAGDVVFVDHQKYCDKALQSAATAIIINKKWIVRRKSINHFAMNLFTTFNTLTRHFNPISY
ncbi:MAG: hypothetical protein IPJ32_16655 [Sphingobacteriaceae bacterium]|nr:hypothetical protein [Sphingobacteriaceae bacterium]